MVLAQRERRDQWNRTDSLEKKPSYAQLTYDKLSSVTQMWPTLCDPMDCSLPGSSIHGIFQARVLERGAIAFSADFILGGSKITADGECSHEIQRHLLLGRKVMTNLDSILKSRNQGYDFSSNHVWMWELDYINKAEPEELMLLNCGVGEDSWQYPGLQGDPTSPS